MTEQDQRIALCEWIGCCRDTNSLDVLHEMEMKLSPEQREKYADFLCDICHDGFDPDIQALIMLPAAQRREALLRTLGLWKD